MSHELTSADERRGGGEPPPWLRLRGWSKTFGVRGVLADVDLDLHAGRIHGLIGQNGSGKSTLIKILAGYHAPDAGAELTIGGAEIALPLAPGEPTRHGISFVHQDLGLFDRATVLENVRLGAYATRPGWRVSWRRERRLVREALARFSVDVDSDATVSTLAPVDRAQVAIVRALETLRGRDGGLLVLDEPTPHLPRDGVERLFASLREVAAHGVAILFVTHRMDEIRELTDEVTVLRDGVVVARSATALVDNAALTRLVLGFSLEELASAQTSPASEAAALEVRDLSGRRVDRVSFDLRAGEIVGLTGLLEMGWDEVPYLLFDGRGTTGTIILDGREIPLAQLSPRRAIELGLALVPADRPRDSMLEATVRENLTMPTLRSYFLRGFLRQRRERTRALELLNAFDVRPREPEWPVTRLSGGNQQKVVVARWFETQPRILLLHEPTQGVDVGARREIYERLRSAAAAGLAVLLASAESEELAGLCDRVLVFRDGRIVSTLEGADVRYERIIEQAFASGGARSAVRV
jgi:ribose transport system ATP-binding protein